MEISIKGSSSSAEKISGHDDLLLHILVRLPIKSLLKFKCVSKHWLSLIKNPHFSRHRGDFLSRSTCISGLFLRWSHSGPLVIHLLDFINLDCNHSTSNYPSSQSLTSGVNYPPDMIIIDSCNRLLLCCSSTDLFNYYICNPTTKQHIMLPPLTQAGLNSGLILAFDPLKSHHYKVINTKREIGIPRLQIEIYSSESGRWRLSEAKMSLDCYVAVYGGVFWNGGIHWYLDSGLCYYFDVDEEEFKEFAMPSPLSDDWSRRRVRYFGESQAHLQLVEIYDPPSTQFDVWEMEKDRSGWLLKYKVNLDDLVSEFPRIIGRYYYKFQILCIVEAGEGEKDEEYSYMVLHIPANIIRYDLKTRSFKKLCDFPPADSSEISDNRHDEDAERFPYCCAHQYTESLVPVAKRGN